MMINYPEEVDSVLPADPEAASTPCPDATWSRAPRPCQPNLALSARSKPNLSPSARKPHCLRHFVKGAR